MFQKECQAENKSSLINFLILLSIIAMLIINDTKMPNILSITIIGKKITLLLIINIVYFIIIIVFNKRIKIDLVFIILFLRIPYFLIHPLIYSSFNESFFANYLIVITAPLVYQMVILGRINVDDLLENVLKFSILIIIIQLVSVYLTIIPQRLPSYMIKSGIKIPLGASNYIAAILLILGIMATTKFKSNIYPALSFFGIFLTLSNSGVIVMIIFLVVLIMRNSFMEISFSNLLKIFIRVILYGLLIFIIFLYIKNQSYNTTIFSRYLRIMNLFSDTTISNQQTIGSIMNGRFEIYSDTINLIKEKPLLGWGLGIVENNHKVHNFLLQSLLNGGFLGFGIYISPLVVVIVRMWKTRRFDYSFFGLAMIFFSFIQGLAEPNYFTSIFELYIWLLITIILRKIQAIDRSDF